MNVLNRKMFANGGAAQAEPNIPELIGYYVSQGFNVLDIAEMLPEIPFGIIETTVSSLGGITNPGAGGPESFEGNFNIIGRNNQDMPETSTITPSLVDLPDPDLPSLDDISMVPPELQEVLAATARFGKDQQLIILTSPNYSFNLSEEEARQILNMPPKPSIDIDMIAPKTPSDLPVVEEVGNIVGTVNKASDLEPNQYRTSAGIVHTIDPTKFAEDLNQENDRILSGILSNPNAEYGSNLASIVESAALKRSSSLVPEEDIKVGQNIMLNPSAEIQTAGKYAVDLFKNTGEGIANAFRSVASPEMVGIFRGREAEEQARLAGRGEDLDLFSTPDSFNPMDYGSTGGERPETLDQIVLSSSLGEDITKSLEDIAADDVKTAEQKEEEVVATEETPAKKETPTTDDATGTSADPVKAAEPGDEPGEDSEEDKLDPIITTANENDKAKQLSQSLGFFQQSDTQRLIRNIGKGLTQYGNFAEGIGKGSAAAAEERVLQEQLDAKREADLAAAGGLEFGDKKDILAKTQEMNLSVRDYNNAVAAQELAESVIDFANGNSNIATFGAKIGAGMDDLLAAAGVKTFNNVDQLSDTKRAQIALTILTNRNIKEILGESGRTISNIDRDIAKKVVGSLDILKLDNIATLKATLDDNIRSIVEKRNQAQRNIQASVRFLAPYDPDAIDSEILKIYLDELGQQMPAGYTSKSSSSSPDSDAIFIDTTQ